MKRLPLQCRNEAATPPEKDLDAPPPPPPPERGLDVTLRVTGRYSRDVFIHTLVYHQPTASSGCICGWAKLGHSHPAHVADMYEKAMAHTDGASLW